MIGHGAVACVDLAVAVAVDKLHVAGAVEEGVGLQAGLVGHAGSVLPADLLALGVENLAGEVVFGEVAVGLKAPDVAVVCAFGVVVGRGVEGVEGARGIVPLGNLGAGVRQGAGHVYVGVAE